MTTTTNPRPRVFYHPFSCPSCGATKPRTTSVRSSHGQRLRDHACRKCGLSYQSIEVAPGSNPTATVVPPIERRVRVTIETVDELIADAILVLAEVREGATTHRERELLTDRIEKLRGRLRAEYRRRGLTG